MVRQRTLRGIGALLQAGGQILGDVDRRRQARQRGERLQELFGTVPELEGFEAAIDPVTGEFDEVALTVLQERGKDRRASEQAQNILNRSLTTALLTDELTRGREEGKERRKLASQLMLDEDKLDDFLSNRGLVLEDLEDAGITQDDFLELVRQGKKLPRGKQVPREGFFGGIQDFFNPQFDVVF